MPARSTISGLPADLRAELALKVEAEAFGKYTEVTEWLLAELEKRGLELSVSRAGVARFGKAIESRIKKMHEKADLVLLIKQRFGDAAGALNDATQQVALQALFDVLVEWEADPSDPADAKKLAALTHAVADISRASVNQKKWEQELKEKTAAVADEVDTIAKQGGLSAEKAALIRAKIFGIAA